MAARMVLVHCSMGRLFNFRLTFWEKIIIPQLSFSIFYDIGHVVSGYIGGSYMIGFVIYVVIGYES